VVDVTAAFPGSTAEEVERQVAVPLEVALAGIPGLKYTRSRCLPGLAHVRCQFEAGAARDRARQEVINRLATISQPLPPAVTPQLFTATAADQILRYVLRGPRDAAGKDIYTLNDLRALQDWVIQRELLIVPGVIDVSGIGGTIRRYEVEADPDRLRRYGITLEQLQQALAAANTNTGGDYVKQGAVALRVRAVGTFGGGKDPVQAVLTLKDPREAAARLRAEEQRRLSEIRSLVVATVNHVPVHLEDLVEGGRLPPGQKESTQGVLVGHQPRTGKVGLWRRGEPDQDDVVGGVVLLRPGEDPQQTLRRLQDRIEQFNKDPGRLLPGVRIEPCYERSLPTAARAPRGAPGIAWVRGAFPANSTLGSVSESLGRARALLARFEEVQAVVSQAGGEGAEGGNFSRAEVLMVLRPEKDWPAPPGQDRPRTTARLRDEMRVELLARFPGGYWDVTPDFRDDLQIPFTAGPGEGLLKIFGPDLQRLEEVATRARTELDNLDGISATEVLHVWGRTSLEFRVDRDKCRRWGVSVADVNSVIQTAIGGIRATTMVEGAKSFDVTLRLPQRMRGSETALLDIPVDIINNQVVPSQGPGTVPGASGTSQVSPNTAGTQARTDNPIANMPRLRLRDLVSPVGDDGQPDPKGSFERAGATAVYRENGRRFIAVRFGLDGADLDTIRKKLAPLFKAPYRAEWERGS
jgi:Cu/Ag efflux pump CusA